MRQGLCDQHARQAHDLAGSPLPGGKGISVNVEPVFTNPLWVIYHQRRPVQITRLTDLKKPLKP